MAVDIHTLKTLEDRIQDLIDHPGRLGEVCRWSSEDAAQFVDELKRRVDQFWWEDSSKSLEFANHIIRIGTLRAEPQHIALGTMARGDTLRIRGQMEESWHELNAAGELFLAIGDEVGWARTRIGRVVTGCYLGYAPQVLREVEQARDIFIRHNRVDRLLRLELNVGHTYLMLGYYQEGIHYQQLALEKVIALQDHLHEVMIYTNLGYAYDKLGNLERALYYYSCARETFTQRANTEGNQLMQQNLAYLAQLQGHYRQALYLLHYVLRQTDPQSETALLAKQSMIECYLHLNRHRQSQDLAEEVAQAFLQTGSKYNYAQTLQYLAAITTHLGQYNSAHAYLDKAEAIYNENEAYPLLAKTALLRGQLAMQQQEQATALVLAQQAAAYFAQTQQQINQTEALRLQTEALIASQAFIQAAYSAMRLLYLAKQCKLPPMRYEAHLLLGQIYKMQGRLSRAVRHFTLATHLLERMLQTLSLTLRPDFLKDKTTPYRALIQLLLAHHTAEQTAQAWQIVETEKSHTVLQYIAQRAQLRWHVSNTDADDSPSDAATLMQELDFIRAEHHVLYRALQGRRIYARTEQHQHSVAAAHLRGRLGRIPRRPLYRGTKTTAAAPQAHEETYQQFEALAHYEYRMREISEQLYLQSAGDSENSVFQPTQPIKNVPLSAVYDHLPRNTVLVEYYDDGQRWWAFIIREHTLEVFALPITSNELDRLLTRLETNINRALQVPDDASTMQRLTHKAQAILSELWAGLIAPWEAKLADQQQVIYIPHGILHYLPFHLFYDAAHEQYLIQRCEVVVQSSAAMLTQTPISRPPGALILAHSDQGKLPQALSEANMVQHMMGAIGGSGGSDEHALIAQAFHETEAKRAVLQIVPRQILHIAAHGEQRLDQPYLSYIQLADGHLYTDDLLQHNLSYELVILSACETGRAQITMGEELIGLGRGFLIAGAGALIASLWRVEDKITTRLMEQLYQRLCQGASKSAALRDAQLAMIHQYPALHPAFWGAFHLIGNSHPLSHLS